ncbi:MAG: outer membrane protein assembly factor BamA [FCB group bacterium]|nr:outer membrane protein assembly factor BamA [FCB group bacterium]
MRKIILYIVIIFILSAAGTASAQIQGVRLLGLTIEGNVTTDQGLIKANSGLLVGREITGEDIQTAIHQLWRLELFSDIVIYLERQVPEGVYLKISVVELPRLEKVRVRGPKKKFRDEIMEKIDLLPGQVVRANEPFAIETKLEEFYAEKGYLLADIKVETVSIENTNRVILDVDINERRKVRIKEITIIGNEAYEKKRPRFPLTTVYWTVDWIIPDGPFSDAKLRKQLDNTHRKRLFRSGEFDRDKFEDDLENLETYYHDHGFRDMIVAKDSVYYSDDLKHIYIDIYVNQGFKYYFGEITYTGNELFSDEELQERLLFKTGDEYSLKKLNLTAHERIGALYYDKGYIYSSVIPVEIPAGADTLDIHFRIIEGNQFSVRHIYITGNAKTKEKVIRREFVLKPGDTFDVSKLRRSIRDVTILNYFGNIVPDVEPVTENQVDLYIDVEEKSTDQAQMSAGYSERDGMIGSVGFTMNNLFGNGQKASLDWNFGSIYRSFSVSFIEPWFMDTPTLLGTSFFHIKRGGSFYGFTEYIIGGSLRFGRRFNWPDDYFRGDWTYRLEQTEYTNFAAAFKASNPRGLEEDAPRLSSSLTQVITRDSRDFPEFPTRGAVVALSTELTGGPLGGADQYHKHIFSSEWYVPLIGKFVLYSHSKMGVLNGLTDNSQDIPYLEYFFMGGSGLQLGESLRGYDEREIGPLPVSGYYPGGKTMFKQTFELRFPLVNNPTIYGLAFMEGGNCWATLEKTDLFDIRRSVGFGIRLFMPMIGLIGLDMGYGIDYTKFDGSRSGKWWPHFQFGRGF